MKNRELTHYLEMAFTKAGEIMLEKWLEDDIEADPSFIKASLQDHYPIIQGWRRNIPLSHGIPIIIRHKFFGAEEGKDTFALVQQAVSQMTRSKTTAQDGAAFILNMLTTFHEDQKVANVLRL